LGMWDGAASLQVIPEDTWAALVSQLDPQGRVAFALDVSPNRDYASIAVAGFVAGGEVASVQVVDNRRDTGWVATRLAELTSRWRYSAVVLDSGGPAASLLPDLRQARVKRVHTITARDVVQACGEFY